MPITITASPTTASPTDSPTASPTTASPTDSPTPAPSPIPTIKVCSSMSGCCGGMIIYSNINKLTMLLL